MLFTSLNRMLCTSLSINTDGIFVEASLNDTMEVS